MGGQRWKVVSEGLGSGVVVREGKEPASRALAERLPKGAIVEETDFDGGHLCFKRLSGVGPYSGWVSVRDSGADLLVRVATPAKSKPAPEAAAPAPAQPQATQAMAESSAAMRAETTLASPAPEAKEANYPLGGWARLSQTFSREVEQPLSALERLGMYPQAILASEDAAPLRPEDLPPVDELAAAAPEKLMQVLGLAEDVAVDFAKQPLRHKKKIVAEMKALLGMSQEKRRDALRQLQKAWPKGPMPTFAPESNAPDLLPENVCFPLSRHLRDSAVGQEAEWGVDAAVVPRVSTVRKKYSPPAAQKEFLRALQCTVDCAAAPVAAEPAARVVETARMAGSSDKDQLAALVLSKAAIKPDDLVKFFNSELQKRVMLLDGCASTRLATAKLEEADFRGERYKNFKETDAFGKPMALKGNNELLSLTRPNLVADMHKEFLLAGSDIIRTNTVNANAVSQAAYKMQKATYEMNKAAAQLAKKAAIEVTRQNRSRPRFVAGALGPCSRPGTPWGELVAAYEEQVRGLVDGGADLLAIEAVSDIVSARAAIYGAEEYFAKAKKKPLPLIITASVADTGRTPAGATLEAICISMRYARPLSIGMSCDMGAKQSAGAYKALSAACSSWCHFCPSAAGDDPEKFAAAAADCAQDGGLNFVGGCAGVTAAHITAAAQRLASAPKRALPPVAAAPPLTLSGLEACVVTPDEGCRLVGQRCTQMGSAKFKRLVDAFKATGSEAKLRAAAAVCADQCGKEADLLDANLDSDCVDGAPTPGKGAMGHFMRICTAEPKIAKAPFMITSCHWDVIKEGLCAAPGKSIVNGICLMLGEEEFLRIAKECMRFGAAVVVLAIGEKGQADTYNDKVKICQQSYKLLRQKLDFPAQDIIFDCQVQMLGAPETASCAIDFINAVGELKKTCPQASFIGGVSNISMGFRNLDMIRDAMHSVFLYHAVPKGLNLALIEPGALPRYTDLNVEVRTLCEEMILNKSSDGGHLDRFLSYATFHSNQAICLPVGKGLPEFGPDWSTSTEAQETQREIRAKRRESTPLEQKESLGSIRCAVSCSSAPLAAGAEAGVSDPLLVEGFAPKDQIASAIAGKAPVSPGDVAKYFNTELRKRVCVLDGPVASKLKEGGLSEADFRGSRFASSALPLQGNFEILSLTKPDVVVAAHREYLQAGADICGTNTFNGSGISQQQYGTESAAYELNKAAAQLAKKAAAEVSAQERDRPRFVAGVLGPTARTLSAAPSGQDPSLRDTTFDELAAAYGEQVRGLVDGGVDMLALLMVSDTLNAKAAVYAIDEYFEAAGKDRLPLLITVDVVDDKQGLRTKSGQSLEAFLTSIRHAKPLAVGVNGAPDMRAACSALSSLNLSWSLATSSSDPAAVVTGAKDKLLNFVGGGSSPSHTASLAKGVAGAPARPPPSARASLKLSGLDAHAVGSAAQLVGQRCNMTGSALFKGLMDAYKQTKPGNRWQAAVQVASNQLAKGADVIDVNFDSDLIDAKHAMGKFIRLCGADPAVAKAPFMISSSSWPVIEEGLKNAQGKCIVNALSLVQGEQEFLRLAKACKRYGAAIVVMAVEAGTPISGFREKVGVCQHAYRLLRAKLDFPAEDIIFDCNVTAAGLQDGMPNAAVDFIEAVAEVKRTCHGVSLMGGVGNVSLGYRGARLLREAMHSTLLYHAIPKGLNFVLAEPGALPRYADLEMPTRGLCDEVVLNTSEDGAHVDRLQSFAAFLTGAAAEGATSMDLAVPEQPLPLALVPTPMKATPSFYRPLETLVQATGQVGGSIFQMFGSKCHAATNFHRLSTTVNLKRCVLFSSISAYMGQGGGGPTPGASSIMDHLSCWERHQRMTLQTISVQWGAIGEIGLRRAIYGSRDVFAQFDLGQKLIGPADTQTLMKALATGLSIPEFLGMAYLDATWQNTLGGYSAGGGMASRQTFADN